MTKPTLSVTQSDGFRKYVHPRTGEAVPSVTTIINAGIPKPWEAPWAAKMASEHLVANWLRLSGESHNVRIDEGKNAYKVYAEQKANVGDLVHDLVDCWSTGKPYPRPPKEISGYVNQFVDFLSVKKPVFIENEVTLFSRMWGYAGTADFIIRIGNLTYLADLKTGRNLHEELGLQLSALGHCDFILREDGTEEPIPEIYGYAGLHLRPRSWKFVTVNEPDECFRAFLAAKDILHWTNNIKPKVLP